MSITKCHMEKKKTYFFPVIISFCPDYVEMWIVMVSMVSGCLMYTVLVANATAMIANIDPAAKEYKSKVLMGDSE